MDSENSLSDLVEDYEQDIKTLEGQIRRAKKELKSCDNYYKALELRKKIKTYGDMRDELIKQSDALKHYYDEESKQYVKRKSQRMSGGSSKVIKMSSLG